MKKGVNIFSFSIGIVVAGLLVFMVAASSPMTTSDTPSDGIKPVFETNENGETYGSIAGINNIEEYPDLIAAVGVDGVEGYFRINEAHPEDPKTPEEALQWQEELKAAGGFYFCNLYDKDGNVIGKMQIGPNE
jgi:hypothetical protein